MKRQTLGTGWYVGFLAIGSFTLYRGISDLDGTVGSSAYLQIVIGSVIVLGASYQLYKTLRDR